MGILRSWIEVDALVFWVEWGFSFLILVFVETSETDSMWDGFFESTDETANLLLLPQRSSFVSGPPVALIIVD